MNTINLWYVAMWMFTVGIMMLAVGYLGDKIDSAARHIAGAMLHEHQKQEDDGK